MVISINKAIIPAFYGIIFDTITAHKALISEYLPGPLHKSVVLISISVCVEIPMILYHVCLTKTMGCEELEIQIKIY